MFYDNIFVLFLEYDNNTIFENKNINLSHLLLTLLATLNGIKYNILIIVLVVDQN